MHPNLFRSCAGMWAIGLLGMWVARGLLALDLETLPFRFAAGLWILGGIGYTGFGLCALAAHDPGRREAKRPAAPRESAPADLSALVRRR